MPRPRLLDDAEILDAVGRIVGRRGLRWTLADVAEEAGLAPATLVQRFGSKHEMVRAYAGRTPARALEAMRQAAGDAHGAERPVAALLALADNVADPEELANHVALLHADLTDPQLLESTRAFFVGVEAELAALVRQAVEEGSLLPCDPADVARRLYTAWNGTLVTWAVHRRGTLAEWATRDLRSVLDRL